VNNNIWNPLKKEGKGKGEKGNKRRERLLDFD